MDLTGGCLCGAVKFHARGESPGAAICHCRMCQRVTGSAFNAAVGFRSADVTWTEGEPAVYASSAGVERGFCSVCGSTLFYARPAKGEIFISLGALDDPDLIHPKLHVFTGDQMSWLHIDDNLPRFEAAMPVGGQKE